MNLQETEAFKQFCAGIERPARTGAQLCDYFAWVILVSTSKRIRNIELSKVTFKYGVTFADEVEARVREVWSQAKDESENQEITPERKAA
jgi:hypothetical protein